MLKVREIIGIAEINFVPQIRGHVKEVINLCDRNIPVIGLRSRFACSGSGFNRHTVNPPNQGRRARANPTSGCGVHKPHLFYRERRHFQWVTVIFFPNGRVKTRGRNRSASGAPIVPPARNHTLWKQFSLSVLHWRNLGQLKPRISPIVCWKPHGGVAISLNAWDLRRGI